MHFSQGWKRAHLMHGPSTCMQARLTACCYDAHRAQAALRIAAKLAWCTSEVLHLLSGLSAQHAPVLRASQGPWSGEAAYRRQAQPVTRQYRCVDSASARTLRRAATALIRHANAPVHPRMRISVSSMPFSCRQHGGCT